MSATRTLHVGDIDVGRTVQQIGIYRNPGIGAWTATATVLASHGDPDVIVLLDYGMPTLVSYRGLEAPRSRSRRR